MARARNIKPSFFTNELLGTEDPMVSLTFAGLWCLADKVGILEDRPLRVKAELFPYREKLDVNGYLSVLARHGFIVRYENSGKRYIQVLNFRKHQSPHHTEKAKGMPFFTDPKSLILEGNGYGSVNEPLRDSEEKVSERSDSLIPDSLIEDSLIHKSSCPQQADDGHRFRFAEIQEAYNRICSPTLPACRASNETRRRQVKRMVDLEFNGKRPFREHGLAMWESYFSDCLTNKHWTGDNDRQWRADFDFVTNPKNAIKLLERVCD